MSTNTDAPGHSEPLAYSIPAAAKVVGVTVPIIRLLIDQRELITFRLGDRDLIRADVLLAMLDRRSVADARRQAAVERSTTAQPSRVAPDDHPAESKPAAIAYSVPDAARTIGVSRATIWRLVAAGELQTFKLGARTLIKADELRAFVESKAS